MDGDSVPHRKVVPIFSKGCGSGAIWGNKCLQFFVLPCMVPGEPRLVLTFLRKVYVCFQVWSFSIGELTCVLFLGEDKFSCFQHALVAGSSLSRAKPHHLAPFHGSTSIGIVLVQFMFSQPRWLDFMTPLWGTKSQQNPWSPAFYNLSAPSPVFPEPDMQDLHMYLLRLSSITTSFDWSWFSVMDHKQKFPWCGVRTIIYLWVCGQRFRV